jgi:hypothetical protein
MRATPKDHPNLVNGLNNLGTMLASRCKRTGESGGLGEDIHVAEQAAQAPSKSPNLASVLSDQSMLRN